MLHCSLDRACETTSYPIFSVKFNELSDPHSVVYQRGELGGVGGVGVVFVVVVVFFFLGGGGNWRVC